MSSHETLDGQIHSIFAEAGVYARGHDDQIVGQTFRVTEGKLDVDEALTMDLDERGVVTAIMLRITKGKKQNGDGMADLYILRRYTDCRAPLGLEHDGIRSTQLVDIDETTGAAAFADGVGPKRQQRAVGILKAMQERLGAGE